MVELIVLFFALILSSASCYVSFNKNLHDKWFYIPVGITIAFITNFIWYNSTKWIGDEKKIYVFSLVWDFIVCLVYLFLPLIMFKIKLDKVSVFGLLLMLIGLIIIKIKN